MLQRKLSLTNFFVIVVENNLVKKIVYYLCTFHCDSQLVGTANPFSLDVAEVIDGF